MIVSALILFKTERIVVHVYTFLLGSWAGVTFSFVLVSWIFSYSRRKVHASEDEQAGLIVELQETQDENGVPDDLSIT